MGMRVARVLQTGRGQQSLFLYGPNNIFVRKLADNAPLATDQTPALKLANMCEYDNASYSYNGSPAPSFYGYGGMGSENLPAGNQVNVNYWHFTIPLYVVDGTVPNQTVTFVQSDGVTPQPAGQSHNMQSFFNAVPVPDVTKIPQGSIPSIGTDMHTCIWRPSTDEMWEMWKFDGTPGNYVFQFGAYFSNVSTFNGIITNGWGARACGLAQAGGLLTIQDIVDILNGFPIRHALGVSIPVTANSHTAPATRNDSKSHTPQYLPDNVTPNPAYGFVDAIPEGTWCRLPPSFDPVTAMSGAGPIALAMATAIRDYGIFVNDGGGGVRFNMEDPKVLGTPYSYAKVNPFAGSTGIAAGFYDTNINQYVPGSWTDNTLDKITENMTSDSGGPNVATLIPWNQLQVLEPFSS